MSEKRLAYPRFTAEETEEESGEPVSLEWHHGWLW